MAHAIDARLCERESSARGVRSGCAVIRLRARRDPSLAIRYSCINGNVCKECTIAIDGAVEYACTTRLRADRVVRLDPLPGKTVLRDLVSEMRPQRERLK